MAIIKITRITVQTDAQLARSCYTVIKHSRERLEMVEAAYSEGSEELPSPENYGAKERFADALEQLPTPEMARTLAELLKPDELRELAEGLLADCAQAARNGSLLESAEAIVGWTATAEEMITTRGRFGALKKTMDEIRAKYEKTG